MADTPSSQDAGLLHVVIGLCTFRRPDDLRDLLLSLRSLVVPAEVAVTVVVVDNDTEPTAASMVKELLPDVPFQTRYVHHPDPGIPSARNRVLDEAAGADFLLFVDDDETVDAQLLVEHLGVQQRTGATFVQGPCEKTVERVQDRWWLKTAFFREREYEDGAERHESWTNNVLVDMAFVTKKAIRFDEKLRFSGGSDTLFFQDVVRSGGRGAYAASALVYERQPKSRLTLGWATRRQYRYGVTRANTLVLRHSYAVALPYSILRAAAMAVVGLAHFASAIVRGRIGFADGLAFISRGAGLALGTIGFKAEEYRRSG